MKIGVDLQDDTIPILTHEEKIAHYKQIAKEFAEMEMASASFENEWMKMMGKPVVYEPPPKKDSTKKKKLKMADVVRTSFSQYFTPKEEVEAYDPKQELE